MIRLRTMKGKAESCVLAIGNDLGFYALCPDHCASGESLIRAKRRADASWWAT